MITNERTIRRRPCSPSLLSVWKNVVEWPWLNSPSMLSFDFDKHSISWKSKSNTHPDQSIPYFRNLSRNFSNRIFSFASNALVECLVPFCSLHSNTHVHQMELTGWVDLSMSRSLQKLKMTWSKAECQCSVIVQSKGNLTVFLFLSAKWKKLWRLWYGLISCQLHLFDEALMLSRFSFSLSLYFASTRTVQDNRSD